MSHSRRSTCLLGFSILSLGLAVGCTTERKFPTDIPASGYTETFDRTALGDDWKNTGGPYRIRDGRLFVQGARNKPLWLKKRLPRNVRIEFDAQSDSPQGDIKVEVFGDGESYAKSLSYTATSYVVIFGGWGNQLNVLARMDEHAEDRAVGPPRRVEAGKVYHFKIERKNNAITAWVDGEELVSMTDRAPLEGVGHEYFAFNNWETPLWFDNVKITPL